MDTEEWVVYSLIHPNTKAQIVNTVSRHRWDRWVNTLSYEFLLTNYSTKLLAEGLTEKQARQIVALTKET